MVFPARVLGASRKKAQPLPYPSPLPPLLAHPSLSPCMVLKPRAGRGKRDQFQFFFLPRRLCCNVKLPPPDCVMYYGGVRFSRLRRRIQSTHTPSLAHMSGPPPSGHREHDGVWKRARVIRLSGEEKGARNSTLGLPTVHVPQYFVRDKMEYVISKYDCKYGSKEILGKLCESVERQDHAV